MRRNMENLALREKDLRKILIALAIYLASLFGANTLGLKIMPFLFGSHISVGVLMFPVVFLMTDVIGEVYGKRMAKLFVLQAWSLLCYSLPTRSSP